MDNETNPSQQSVSSTFAPTIKQREAQKLLQSAQRHTLLVGGSRSGKTTLLVHEIVIRALQSDGSRHAILRLRGNAARASIALDTLPKLFRLWFPGRPLKRHRVEGYFSLENQSEIWIGGLDDKERVEKILGKEYVTIFLNECSRIPYSSVLIALTRLAQVADGLQQAAYYDLNPTSKGHWTNVLFGDKRDPISRLPLESPDDYARMFLNPGDNAVNPCLFSEDVRKTVLFFVSFLREAVRKTVLFFVSFHRNALSRWISLLSVVEGAPMVWPFPFVFSWPN